MGSYSSDMPASAPAKKDIKQKLAEAQKAIHGQPGDTLLTHAIRSRDEQLADYLVKTNPELVLRENSEGQLPLQLALSSYYNPYIARSIIEKVPASVKIASTKDNLLAIGAAVRYLSIPECNTPIIDLINLLLAHGANVNDGLLSALNRNELSNALFFLKKGADAGVKDAKESNVVHKIITRWTSPELDHCMVNIRKHATQLLIAILELEQIKNDPGLKELLINSPDPITGLKPLCAAAQMGWTEGAQILIEHGADCADDRYKDFLVPLINKSVTLKAKATGAHAVLQGTTQEDLLLPRDLSTLVGQFLSDEEGEKKRQESVSSQKQSSKAQTSGGGNPEGVD